MVVFGFSDNLFICMIYRIYTAVLGIFIQQYNTIKNIFLFLHYSTNGTNNRRTVFLSKFLCQSNLFLVFIEKNSIDLAFGM